MKQSPQLKDIYIYIYMYICKNWTKLNAICKLWAHCAVTKLLFNRKLQHFDHKTKNVNSTFKWPDKLFSISQIWRKKLTTKATNIFYSSQMLQVMKNKIRSVAFCLYSVWQSAKTWSCCVHYFTPINILFVNCFNWFVAWIPRASVENARKTVNFLFNSLCNA